MRKAMEEWCLDEEMPKMEGNVEQAWGCGAYPFKPRICIYI